MHITSSYPSTRTTPTGSSSTPAHSACRESSVDLGSHRLPASTSRSGMQQGTKRQYTVSSSPELHSSWGRRQRRCKAQSRSRCKVSEPRNRPSPAAPSSQGTGSLEFPGRRSGEHVPEALTALLAATPSNVIHLVQSYLASHPTAVQAAMALAAFRPEGINACVLGQQLGLSYLLQHHADDHQMFVDYLVAGGNMQKLLQNDPVQFGGFLAQWPEAVAALPGWTQQLPQEMASTFLQDCAAVLTTGEFSLSGYDLGTLLDHPTNPEVCITSLRNLADHNRLPEVTADRLLLLAAALSTSADPHLTLKQLVKSSTINLLSCLTPDHLGRALQTGLVKMQLISVWSSVLSVSQHQQQAETASLSRIPVVPPRSSLEVKSQTAGADDDRLFGYEALKRRRKAEGPQLSDYADLRHEMPPQSPVLLQQQFAQRQCNPASPEGAALLRFEASFMLDPRRRRFEWWAKLSQAKLFVLDYYRGTEWENHANCTSTGNTGHEVVRTPLGTATWVPNDKRISITLTNKSLLARLATVFEPWNLQKDLARKYHRGRLPQQIQSLLNQAKPSAEDDQLFQ